jgi:penicillin-binding protein 1A
MSQKKKKSSKKSSAKTAKKAVGPQRSFIKTILMWGATLCVWGAIVVAGIVAYYAYDLPDVDEATSVARRPGITLLAENGQVIATSGDLYGQAIQVRDLPDYLPQAVMATEDRRFYDHFGVDIIGLGRAVVTNILSGRVRQGGSTLTQQVAKNLFLSPERSIKRKVQELLLAFWLEKKFTKDQIFTLYLNRVYFGAGTYGVEAAAQKYFSKSARRLNLYESALIAGLLKAPSRYNPRANPKLSEERTAVVLMNMVNAGYLTKAQANAAKSQKNKVYRAAKPHKSGRYFADWVLDQVSDYVGPQKKDLIVETTLDLDLQHVSEKQVRQILAKHAKSSRVSQAAVVVLSPQGAVRAMVGGRDYGQSQFNRATQAQRQPGSSFKPFVFLAGIESGQRATDKMIDKPVSIGKWKPKNYSGRYEGDMTLSYAMAHSVNSVAAQIIQRVGPTRVVETAHKMGIISDLKAHPSIALGSSEVNLLELTAAYGPFANGGYGVFPYAIVRITDRNGSILYERSGGGSGQIITPRHVGEINKMMKAVMIEGSGRKANFDRPLGGKTGTSQSFRDGWFVGYSADLVAGVWMGNDNEKPMKNVSGSGLPAILWGQIMKKAHENLPPKPLPGEEAPAVVERVKGFFERLFGSE